MLLPEPSDVAFVAVAALPVQEPEEPLQLPVTLPVRCPENLGAVTVASLPITTWLVDTASPPGLMYTSAELADKTNCPPAAFLIKFVPDF